MNVLTTVTTREIINDFAKEIAKRKQLGPKPAKCVINFRQEATVGIERDIYYVPLDLLRYRKDNGRISSDVLNYEKSHGLLDEKSKDAQDRIEGFLKEKDKEKTEELREIILHDGQRDPAIITCDGFLINGNRRKMVMESLHKQYPGDPRFTDIKVVILPGEEDEGGPPSLLEIEQIENRYQLQSEGKAEYYAFDRAISIRRKKECGMTVEEQLRDDPRYAALETKKFKKEVDKYEKEYLAPLECIDRYLASLNREGLYSTVSTGLGDPEGRWQAFRDYYHFVYQKIADEKTRLKLGIHEHDVGKIEDIAFKIVRMRKIADLPKVHMIMRQLPKWLANGESRNELFALNGIDVELGAEENVDAQGHEYHERELDLIWARKNATKVIRHVKEAKYCFDHQKERDTPIELMKAALKKLNHENLRPEDISTADYSEAMKIAKEIQERANELEHEFFSYQKQLTNLANKYKRQ